MNNVKCGDCEYFDQKYKGQVGGVPTRSWLGWCAKRTIYPNKEQDGQVFPPDVQRAAPDAKPTIVVVHAGNCVPHCTEVMRRNG